MSGKFVPTSIALAPTITQIFELVSQQPVVPNMILENEGCRP